MKKEKRYSIRAGPCVHTVSHVKKEIILVSSTRGHHWMYISRERKKSFARKCITVKGKNCGGASNLDA